MEIAYHYTTLDSFLKMIEGSKKKAGDDKLKNFIFWASSVYALNDPEELLYGFEHLWNNDLKCIEKELGIHKDENRISDVWKSVKSSKTDEEWNNVLLKSLYDSHDVPFALSFSLAKDFLPMWNTYANNATGISLGFKNFVFNVESINDKNNIEPIRYLHAITVSYGQIGESLRKTLKDIYSEFFKRIQNTLEAEQKQLIKMQYLATSIVTALAYVKHKAYEYEREVRIIKNVENCEKDRIKYRISSNGNLIPYIEFPIPSEYLDCIIVGPCGNFEMIKRELSAVLQSVGINVEIIQSTIPYRNY